MASVGWSEADRTASSRMGEYLAGRRLSTQLTCSGAPVRASNMADVPPILHLLQHRVCMSSAGQTDRVEREMSPRTLWRITDSHAVLWTRCSGPISSQFEVVIRRDNVFRDFQVFSVVGRALAWSEERRAEALRTAS